jgi:hypothetical protein
MVTLLFIWAISILAACTWTALCVWVSDGDVVIRPAWLVVLCIIEAVCLYVFWYALRPMLRGA